MNRVKRFVSLLVIVGVIFMGASNARAGLVMSDLTGDQDTNQCTERVEKVDNGIIIIALSSIFGDELVKGWFKKSEQPVNCGVIVFD
jgi:hypothetical protein